MRTPIINSDNPFLQDSFGSGTIHYLQLLLLFSQSFIRIQIQFTSKVARVLAQVCDSIIFIVPRFKNLNFYELAKTPPNNNSFRGFSNIWFSTKTPLTLAKTINRPRFNWIGSKYIVSAMLSQAISKNLHPEPSLSWKGWFVKRPTNPSGKLLLKAIWFILGVCKLLEINIVLFHLFLIYF